MADLDFVKLKAIATEVGRDWKMLGRHLGLPEHEIQQITQEHRYDLHEASLQVLMRYIMRIVSFSPHIFTFSDGKI